MRAAVQRVSRAKVTVDDQITGQIGPGLLVYAAAAPDDAEKDVSYIANKVVGLRIFTDQAGKMNLSVAEIGGGVLVVSAFSILGDARKGRRPSFIGSAPRDVAEPLIDKLTGAIRTAGLPVETGRFAAYMRIDSVNDGPICILLDSRRVL